MFTAKVLDVIFAASVAAAARFVGPPRSHSARARPKVAKLTICASPAAVAAVIAASKRFFASAKIGAGCSSGPRLIAAEHIASPMSTRLYPAYADAWPMSFVRLGTSASVQVLSQRTAVSADARATDNVV